MLHGISMQKVMVNSKKWCDLGKGRGYWYKRSKFLCKKFWTKPNNPDIMESFCDSEMASSMNNCSECSNFFRCGEDSWIK